MGLMILGMVLAVTVAGTVLAAPSPSAPADFTLSRETPAVQFRAQDSTQFLLRAERDIQRLRLEIQPPQSGSGEWRAEVRDLGDAVEAGAVDLQKLPSPSWSVVVRQGGRPGRYVSASLPVPRRHYRVFHVRLRRTGADAGAVQFRAAAIPIDPGSRLSWLIRMRDLGEPVDQPERTRDLIRMLTDAEVAHWTGDWDRETFLAVWLRATAEVLARDYPGRERAFFFGAGAPLPDGRVLNSNGRYLSHRPQVPRGFSGTFIRPGDPTRVRPAPEQPDTGIVLDVGGGSPAYRMRVRSEDGAAHLAFRFQPDARSVELTLVAPRVSPGPVPVVTRTRLVDRRAGSDAAPLLEGRVSTGSGRPPTPPVLRFLQQRFWLPNGGPISEWTLELRTVAPDGAAPPALDVEVRVIADARPITAQEAALMRWRDSVPDPLAAPDRVREMVAQLSDDEVRYYTGFQDRAAFLKHWQRTGRSALRGPVGALVFTEEVQGLLRPGNPLPDGRYLHHNGKVPALLD